MKLFLPSRFNGSFKKKTGMALVVCLALIVLITAAVLAFFARATSNRIVESTRTNRVKIEQLAKTAGDYVTSRFLQEITMHSISTTNNDVVVYQPNTNSFAVPQRPLPATLTSDASFANLFRRSVNESTNGVGETNASVHNTATASRNGRKVGANRWNAPGLISGSGFTTTNQLPNWIYVNANGTTTNTPTTNAIGRFAYTAYDTGSLLDANVAGYPAGVSGTNLANLKGSLAGADLSVIPGIGSTINMDAFVQWRNPSTSGSTAAYVAANANSGTNGFLAAQGDDNRLVNRQDLIKLARNGGYGITTNALPYLTTFTRSLNAPSFTPATNRPFVQAQNAPLPSYTGQDDAWNPSLINLRTSGTDGDPLLKKRFPLTRLALVTRNSTANSSSDIFKYFGLQRGSSADPWTYNHGSATSINTLAQVAALNRPPDFFELLKSAISLGSLAKSSENTFAIVNALDAVPDHQIIQIGANLIDQFDVDSFPTRIAFNTSFNPIPVFSGIENLPYLAQVYQTPYRFTARPGDTLIRPNVGEWLQPVVWNPHAAPLGGPDASRPSEFRFVVEGSAFVRIAAVDGVQKLSAIKTFPDPSTDPNLGIKFTTTSARLFGEPTLLNSSIGATAIGTDDQSSEAGFMGIHVETMSAPEKMLNPAAPPSETDVREWQWCQVVPQPYTTYLLQYLDSGTWITYSRMRYISQGLNYKASSGLGNYFNRYFPITMAQLSDPRSDHFGAIGGSIIVNPVITPTLRPASGSGSGSGLFVGPNSAAKGWTFGGAQPYAGFTTAYFGSLSDNLPASETRYIDPDGVLRPADGAYTSAADANAGHPMVTGNSASRPIVLNRPFRSVAEMGYASRGMPWKHLDFFTKDSADAALLDVFTVSDAPEMVAGVLNPNTRQPLVLKAVLQNAVVAEETASSLISDHQASLISTALTDLSDSTIGPLLNRSDLATKLGPALDYDSPETTIIKRRREAAIRALSAVSNTRTWNLFLDIVAQSGRFSGTNKGANDFIVEGEKRIWLQIAVDRYMGKVIAERVEPAYE